MGWVASSEEIGMAEPLKNIFFTKDSLAKFVQTISRVYPQFDGKKFLSLIHCPEWDGMELKERMRHTTLCLGQTLPQDYRQALAILDKTAPSAKGFEAGSLPDFVEVYGLDDWEASLSALKRFTRYFSSEFAIRPFLDRDPERAMALMLECAEDEEENVRRFASEGCRPRLPWAMALPRFKKDPGPIFAVLEKLKDDPSEFVRRSVANNLNDISKDHPGTVLDLAERWLGRSERTDWIVKQACRTLLKAGNTRAMRLFGFGDPSRLHIRDFRLSRDDVRIGEDIHFMFDLVVEGGEPGKVRLEYRVDYAKSQGKRSKKIFQISEKDCGSGVYSYKRKQTFADMSTRKHYPGEHRIAVIVNGVVKAEKSLRVKEA
jgi:3-methyladenine DNA glycosylase AlkC